ncbi:ORF103 [Staphylococcus phage 69]|uniref:ORF103 n=1 Tax=Staphylococcus phage 69 TaxID=2908097 RepID=Q4ZDT4_9CAUD|nr:ORF103 [Staphylococcus phage 69]
MLRYLYTSFDLRHTNSLLCMVPLQCLHVLPNHQSKHPSRLVVVQSLLYF